MNRVETLRILFRSLDRTNFDGDRVELIVSVDFHPEQHNVIQLARNFHFKHGSKQILVSSAARGLAKSWYQAWLPPDDNSRAVILEDDIELSAGWYKLLKHLWLSYGDSQDLAGISLQRQTLVPYEDVSQRSREIVNGHKPFMYPLVGSIAFSPHPKVWGLFLRWIDTIQYEYFDVSTPGLVTSNWWNTLDKKHMWTQHFIYYSLLFDYYTLYINLPGGQTAAAHLRAKGAHFSQSQGHDFPVARSIQTCCPIPRLQKFDWDGEILKQSPSSSVRQTIMLRTVVRAAQRIAEESKFTYLMFLNSGFLEMGKNWVCNLRRVAPSVLRSVIFITTDTPTARSLHTFAPDLFIFTVHSIWTQAADFGTYAYYNSVLDRMRIQLLLLQAGVAIQIVEADQIWKENVHGDILHALEVADLVVVEEGDIVYAEDIIKRFCGGFYAIKPTLTDFYESYFKEYESSLLKRAPKDLNAKIESFLDDQAFLTLRAREENVNTSFMPDCVYVTGLWYALDSRVRERCPHPKIIHNNYIIGERRKVARAKTEDQWFLSSQGSCM